MQRRLHDIGWSDEKKCQGCNKEESRRSTDCATAHVGKKSETRSQRRWGNGSKEQEHHGRTENWPRGITTHSLSEKPRE